MILLTEIALQRLVYSITHITVFDSDMSISTVSSLSKKEKRTAPESSVKNLSEFEITLGNTGLSTQ